jgi:hypothetical protein
MATACSDAVTAKGAYQRRGTAVKKVTDSPQSYETFVVISSHRSLSCRHSADINSGDFNLGLAVLNNATRFMVTNSCSEV